MKFCHKLISLFIVLSVSIFAQTKISVGDKAPDFTLHDAFGNEYVLSSYFGEAPVVIYFYPQAGTSGCTKQACGIRDDWSKFEENNIKVFGISTDSKSDIEKFIKDYYLNFPLLSDEDKIVSKKYGVLKDNGYDQRVTFIIDMNGNVSDVINVTDIESHAEYVFNEASKLNSNKKDTD